MCMYEHACMPGTLGCELGVYMYTVHELYVGYRCLAVHHVIGKCSKAHKRLNGHSLQERETATCTCILVQKEVHCKCSFLMYNVHCTCILCVYSP